MNLIAAVTENWGIGMDGKLLCSIPEDMKYFREKTMGKTVLMGRKTLESFPEGRPLRGRVNIVLSSRPAFRVDGAVVLKSLGEALEELGKYPEDDVFVIGGAQVYELMMPYCRYAYITRMDVLKPADSFLPNLDEAPGWSVDEQGEKRCCCCGIWYRFVRYVNSDRKEYR